MKMCCFFDAEVVKNQENIDVESKEFKLFRKLRNKETDEWQLNIEENYS